jgi:hypothetical protein
MAERGDKLFAEIILAAASESFRRFAVWSVQKGDER